MHILENDIDICIDGIYKYKVVDNVIDYKYDDFDKWVVKTNNTNDESNTNYYLIIDCIFHEAFGHWVYESAIYLLLYIKLKKIYANIKLHLKCYKQYKLLFCEFFNISADDIVLELDHNNRCIFPLPISSLNNKSISDDYKYQVDAFISHIQASLHNNDKPINILLLPRQTKENCIGNNRFYNIDDISQHILKDANNMVLHTDNIKTLKEQINIVNISKNLIVTGGSPFLVNGILCKNANIIMLDDVTIRQNPDYIKMQYIHNKILDINKINIIPNKNAFTYRDIHQFLI